MRILFVISSLDVGGAEKVLSSLANYFDAYGYNITILTLSKNKPFFTLNSSIKLIQLGVQSKDTILNRINYIPSIIYSLKENILSSNPNIIISFMSQMNILMTIASKWIGIPIIISERTNFNSLKSKKWRILRKVVYPFSDALIVQSRYDRNKYSFHKNCNIIYNPISVKNIDKDIKREKIVLAVGRLIHEKGFDMLIDAFSTLNHKDWKLVILGEGDYRDKLEEKILKKGIDNIYMLGKISDVENYYKKASIFVLSSRIEGFPNVLIEAMAYGCASIAFNCLTGPNEIIKNGENGILVETNNIQKLSDEINNLIESPKKRALFSQGRNDILDRFYIDKIAKNWIDIISNVLEKR